MWGGLDHFGVVVDDIDTVIERARIKFPQANIVKRPSTRPFANYSGHDPDGNIFDLAQKDEGDKPWSVSTPSRPRKAAARIATSTNSIRTMNAERCADFYQFVFELKPGSNKNVNPAAGGYHLTDGRVTLAILPWSIPIFENMSIKRPGPDHIGFKVESIEAFKQHVETTSGMNPDVAPMRLGGSKEADAWKAFLRCRPAAVSQWPSWRRLDLCHGRVIWMEFGVFDHLDRDDQPLGDYYRSRLQIVEAYERLGFYAYHIAEHHATPLGLAPSPSVFLAAVAQRTRRLRFGPLVYALPLYHPMRLIEEICMLDQMSGGRLEFGFGRGSSPSELIYYGQDPGQIAADLCRGARSRGQGSSERSLHFPRRVLPFRRRADGSRAVRKTASADLVRRPCARQRRARGRKGWQVVSLICWAKPASPSTASGRPGATRVARRRCR